MPSTIFSKPLNKQVAQNTADIAALSTSMGNANGAMAIVATGDTAPKAIPAGQFVLWRGGLHTANSAIASGETLSSSNLTAVPDGGLNAVKSAIPAVVDNLTSDSTNSALSAAQGKALNGKMETYNLGTNTLANIQSAMVSYVNSSMSDFSVKNVRFTPSAATGIFKVLDYIGTIHRIYATRFTVEARNKENDLILGEYDNGTWSWQSLNWQNVTLTAAQGSFTNVECKKNNKFVCASIEFKGPITAYQNFVTGFPSIGMIYYGEALNSDKSVRRTFYIQGGGVFLRTDLAESEGSIRATIVAPLL